MRNDPCPCGSGKKFKKCHGAAVPPEVAALPADARAEWQRAEVVLQRQKRVGQEMLDWATKKLGAEWTDAALDAWGLTAEENIGDMEADIYTGWVLFSYVHPTLGKPLAAAWLDDAGKRASDDDRALAEAMRGAQLGVWEAETVEEGVGATLTDRLSGRTLFVHEPDLTHMLSPSEYVCAYVLEANGVHVFAGMHDDTLIREDGAQFVAELLAQAGGDTVPAATLADAKWQARTARTWHALAETLYAEVDGEDGDDGEDAEGDDQPEASR
jgi:hypothetical protein